MKHNHLKYKAALCNSLQTSYLTLLHISTALAEALLYLRECMLVPLQGGIRDIFQQCHVQVCCCSLWFGSPGTCSTLYGPIDFGWASLTLCIVSPHNPPVGSYWPPGWRGCGLYESQGWKAEVKQTWENTCCGGTAHWRGLFSALLWCFPAEFVLMLCPPCECLTN